MLERDCLPELLALPEAISPPLTRAHVPSPLHMFTCAAELAGQCRKGRPWAPIRLALAALAPF